MIDGIASARRASSVDGRTHDVAENAKRRIPLRWGDFDSQGHVYHAVALSLVDEARSKWFESRFSQPDTDYLIARIEADYYEPIDKTMEYVDFTVEVAHMGNKSIQLRELALSPIGVPLFASRAWIVIWDARTAKSRPLNAGERAILSRELSQEETKRKESSQ